MYLTALCRFKNPSTMAGRKEQQQYPYFSFFSYNWLPLKFFIESNNGHVFEINENVAMEFDFIKKLIKEGHIKLTYDARPLITSNTTTQLILGIVIMYTKNFVELRDRLIYNKCDNITISRAIRDYDIRFVNWLTNEHVFGSDLKTNMCMIGDIAAAAAGLGMKRLLELSCRVLSELKQEEAKIIAEQEAEIAAAQNAQGFGFGF